MDHSLNSCLSFETINPIVFTGGGDGRDRGPGSGEARQTGCGAIPVFVTLNSRVRWYTQSMSLEYEPASEPLHIYVK